MTKTEITKIAGITVVPTAEIYQFTNLKTLILDENSMRKESCSRLATFIAMSQKLQ